MKKCNHHDPRSIVVLLDGSSIDFLSQDGDKGRQNREDALVFLQSRKHQPWLNDQIMSTILANKLTSKSNTFSITAIILLINVTNHLETCSHPLRPQMLLPQLPGRNAPCPLQIAPEQARQWLKVLHQVGPDLHPAEAVENRQTIEV